MKYYQDITLLPDAETNLGFLWQKVYQQIHLALVENKIAKNESAIAVSFPQYGDKEFPLGNKLRLFSEAQKHLKLINLDNWLRRLTDYTHTTSIKEVPLSVEQYACFNRKQFDTNVERMARRRSKRKKETFEQALTYLKNFKDTETKLPFINMKSLSGERKFKLFIEQKIVEESVVGEFNCYGLSGDGQAATIPWF